MKSLVQPECGGANALVDLSTQFARPQNARLHGNVVRSMMPSSSMGEKFVQEYLSNVAASTPAPSTFNMRALVSSLPQSSSHVMASHWSAEYAPQASSSSAMARNWSNEYAMTPAMHMETAWQDAVVPSVGGQLHAANGPAAMMWSSEYLANFDQQTMHSNWKSEQVANQWADEYTAKGMDEAAAGGFWQNLESEWDTLARTDPTFQWNPPTVEEYQMQGENPFLEADGDLLARGEDAMMKGQLANAILQLEAAVTKNPEDAKAWCLLGLCQAENEQDNRAIAAFRRSLNIDPLNLDAILGLAVSYANESMENDALMQLQRWLDANAEYSHPQASAPRPPTSSFLDQARFAQVEQRFLDAANRQRADGPDAALQNALGILYNLNRNYDRAVDSIKAALVVRPDDARLWNRLGATLANGERTVEAVAAYRRALQLFPAYVRARYNLGISCMHLDSHREALSHFLSALQLQGPDASGSTGGIWQTVRSAILRFSPQDPQLLAASERRDITALQQALAAQTQ